jgi:hypothetical protein
MKALCITLGVCFLHAVSLVANPIPSESKTREWKEYNPQVLILHVDNYVDYARDGKVVFRLIERKTNIKAKPDDPDDPVITRYVEFIFDGKVFANVLYNREGRLSPTLATGGGIYFSGVQSNLPGQPWRFVFHVCVPKYDYFEYVEIGEKGVITPPMDDQRYREFKGGMMKMADKGYLWKFQGEKDD